jgi:hypothetical protein
LASQAVLDMGTRLTQDLRTTAIQVGKALQDPVLGMTAMRRMGVNFDKGETNYVKGLIASGQKYKAQMFVLDELNREFAGSAKAAYDANPLSEYDRAAENLKETVGGVALKIQTALEPSLISLTNNISNSIDWMEKHATMVKTLAGLIGGLTVIINYNRIATALMSAWDSIATVATGALAAVTWLFSAALWSTGIPEIVIVIGALVVGIIELWKHSEKFREIVFSTWEVVKAAIHNIGEAFIWLWDNAIKPVVLSIWEGIQWVVDKITPVFHAIGSFFVDLWKTVKGVFENIWHFAVNAFDKIMDKLSGIFAPIRALWNKLFPSDKFQDLGEAAAKGVSEGAKSWDASKSAIKAPELAGVVKPVKTQNGGSGTGAGTSQAIATGGTRNTQITIKLGKMVENIIFNGSVKENAQDLTRQVEEALMRVLYSAESAG